MTSANPVGLTIPEAIAILRRYRLRSFAVAIVAIIATLAAIVFLPRTYQSEARMLVRIGRSTVGMDPTVTQGPTNPVHKTLDSEILSVQSSLYSRTLLEKTVDKLGPDFILGEGDPNAVAKEDDGGGLSLNPLGYLRDFAVSAGVVDDLPLREKAIIALSKQLVVFNDAGSSIVICQLKGNHPLRAQRVLETYLDFGLAQHVEANTTTGAHEFFVNQLKLLQTQWQEKADELTSFKNERNLTSVEGERALIEAELKEVETGILSASSQWQESTEMCRALMEQYTSVPETHNAAETDGNANQASDLLMQTYYGLLIEEARLAARYSDENPLLSQVREQIRAAEKAVQAEPETRSTITKAINPTRVQLEFQLATERAKTSALKARMAALTEQREALHERVARLNSDEKTLRDLQQQVDTLAASARQYSQDIEATRISEQLESSRISNLNLIQQPTFEPKALEPKLIILFALGFVAAVGGGIAIAFASEFWSRLAGTLSLATAAEDGDHGDESHGEVVSRRLEPVSLARQTDRRPLTLHTEQLENLRSASRGSQAAPR